MKIRIPRQLKPLARAFEKADVKAYAVGGLVRNAFLNLPPSDIDVCSELTPDEIVERMPEHAIRVIPKAAEMGTVELHFGDVHVEHTTFRSEAYGEGGAHRPRTVAFGTSLEDDAYRRDFSVNALYADLSTGEVFDPTGGIADLERRILRTTSRDPDEIMRSDALRVLRLVRFACELGLTVEDGTMRAAKRNAPKLSDIAPERRQQELVKILLCDARYPALGNDELRAPLRALRMIDELDLWSSLVPAFNQARGMAQRPTTTATTCSNTASMSAPRCRRTRRSGWPGFCTTSASRTACGKRGNSMRTTNTANKSQQRC
jgi:tRNA nucleotidyltransferase/poly(A) polymerase